MLRQSLDDEGAAGPGRRARLTSLAGTERMPMEIWWAVLQEVADVHPRVATGIEIGKHARPHHVGVLGYLAMSCDTLGQALARFQRFQPPLHNLTPTPATPTGDDFQLSCDPSHGRPTLLPDAIPVPATLTHAWQWTGTPGLTMRSVEFP